MINLFAQKGAPGEKEEKPETPQKNKNNKEECHIGTATSRRVVEEQNKEMGCNCSKSKCLKMYCACFSQGNMCKPSCYCINCKNYNDNMERSEAINQIITKDPHAFSRRHSKAEFIQTRCNCKKSNCLKKYCDCYKLGKGCGKQCQCLGCQNKFNKNEEFDFLKKIIKLE